MSGFALNPARKQSPLDLEPYDRWVVGKNQEVKAEFYSFDDHFLVRFPGEADFTISHEGKSIAAYPLPQTSPEIVDSLFRNAIEPVLGNHNGGLFLHGSAVSIDGYGVAFLGTSRSGKTTLAGYLAKAGHPFLTEDVIDLSRDSAGSYWMAPKQRVLRLFKDSADFLLGADIDDHEGTTKVSLQAPDDLPFSTEPVRLSAIFILAHEYPYSPEVHTLGPQAALGQLMPHSFLLDVTDRKRLKQHFSRLADLSQAVDCYSLDYGRDYEELPAVQSAVISALGKLEN